MDLQRGSGLFQFIDCQVVTPESPPLHQSPFHLQEKGQGVSNQRCAERPGQEGSFLPRQGLLKPGQVLRLRGVYHSDRSIAGIVIFHRVIQFVDDDDLVGTAKRFQVLDHPSHIVFRIAGIEVNDLQAEEVGRPQRYGQERASQPGRSTRLDGDRHGPPQEDEKRHCEHNDIPRADHRLPPPNGESHGQRSYPMAESEQSLASATVCPDDEGQGHDEGSRQQGREGNK